MPSFSVLMVSSYNASTALWETYDLCAPLSKIVRMFSFLVTSNPFFDNTTCAVWRRTCIPELTCGADVVDSGWLLAPSTSESKMSLARASLPSQTAKWWWPWHPKRWILELQLRAKWPARRKQIKHHPCFYKMPFLSSIFVTTWQSDAWWFPLQNKQLILPISLKKALRAAILLPVWNVGLLGGFLFFNRWWGLS